MYKIVAIGGQDFCTGFALAGIETQVVTESSIQEVLARVLARDDLALVILDESWSDAWQQARPPALKARLPIMVPVPGQMRWRDVEKPQDDQYIASLIRQAVGYQLDIQL